MKITSFFVLLCFCISTVAGQDCSTLGGTWYNELGSMMNVRQSQDGLLAGEYRTLVEREPGAAGGNFSYLNGVAPYNKPDTVFGFSVMWRNGSSMTSWTGQCFMCDGIEILKTSWILKIRVNSCSEIWESTMIGQNFFTRTEWDAKQFASRRKRDTTDVKFKAETKELLDNPELSLVQCGDLTGTWYNQAGSVMTIDQHNDNQIRGEYITAVESCDGAAGPEDSQPLYGTSFTPDPSSTIALFVLWNGGESITGWAGQCHVCKDDGVERLVLTWLLRSKVATCGDNWISTNYGESVFTREPQTGTANKKLTANEVGESAACTNKSGGRILSQEVFPVLFISLTSLIMIAM